MDVIDNIVREDCKKKVALRKDTTVIQKSNVVYRELFYDNKGIVGSRVINMKTGNIVNSKGCTDIVDGIFIYGLTCPKKTTALIESDCGLRHISMNYICDVFKHHTESIEEVPNLLVINSDESYSELIFALTAESYMKNRG